MTAPSVERRAELDGRSDAGRAAHQASAAAHTPIHPHPPGWRRRERQRERLTLLVLFLVLVAVTFGNQWGKFAPDTKPDLYYVPGRFLQGTLSAWLPELGQAGRGNFNTGQAPVAVVIYVLRAIGLSPWVVVRVWRLALFVIAAWGIRRYFHDLVDRRSNRLARTVVTVLYVANAFVITQGNTTPELLPYAMLPWLLLAHRRSLQAPRSWRAATLFALAFFAMTGMNAGVVPIFLLLALPAQAVAAKVVDGVGWRDQLRSLVRIGTLSVLVSLYWLLPAALASSTGSGIASATESPASVAQTTSYAEVGRLLGHWPIYGRFGPRLYEPGYVSYLTSPLVVISTLLIPVAAALCAWWARASWRRLRLTAGVLLAIALPVEVGLFPPTDMPLIGRTIKAVFDKVPATLAFRTTSKIGPLVLLALVLCVGIGAEEANRRARHWSPPVRYGGALLAFAVVAGSVYPAWSNNLYDSAWNVPGYWERAATSLDRLPDNTRILAVPGGAGGNYRWGMRSPDDLFPSLFQRTVVSHVTVAGEGETAANLMAGTDVPLNQGTLPPGSLSTLARYLGAGQVLVRNDTRYEEVNGAPPSTVHQAVADDPGLRLTTTYGRPGQNILRPDQPRDQQDQDLSLHPLEQYSVRAAVPTVRAEPVGRTLLIDGDGFAVPTLAEGGLLDGYRPFRYMGDLDTKGLAAVIDGGGGIALTDTNRRRTWSINRLTDAYSSTLSADDDIRTGVGPSLTLFPDRPETQTTTKVEGVDDISASPLDFGEHAYGKAQFAFDADPSTRWNAGPFGTAKGKQVTVDVGRVVRLNQVGITVQDTEPSRITGVTVEAGGQRRQVDLSNSRVGVAVFPDVSASEVTVTVTGVSPGANEVGLASIDIPGVVAREVTKLPTTFSDLYRGLPKLERFKLGALPIDILFTRQTSGGAPTGDEELDINRDFELPLPKTFGLTASLARLDDAPQDVVRGWRDARSVGTAPCARLGTLDGRAVSVRPARSVLANSGDQPVDLVDCDPVPLPLDVGRHQFRSAGGWRLDTVHLSSAPSPSGRAPVPQVVVQREDDTHLQLRASNAQKPYYLVTGQAYDPGWTAFVDGKALGEPITLDGYSVGWRIPAGAHRIDVAYGPQRFVSLSFALSAVSLFGVVVVLTAPSIRESRRRRRRRRRPSSDPPAASP